VKTLLVTLVALAAGTSAAFGAQTATGTTISPPEKMLGPSGRIDSVFATVRDQHGLHAYLSNKEAYWYDQRADGSLHNPRRILSGGGPGSVDQCGVHPVGTIYKDPAARRSHWIGFYHAERGAPADDGRCHHPQKHTRWTIVRMETFNGGRTWHKGDQVITQDKALLSENGVWSYRKDDAGSPRLVIRGRYMYLFYRAVNRLSGFRQEMSIARAPVSSKGRAGKWKKWHNGAYSEPGLGGQQSPISGLPAQARGISYNSHVGEYLAVRVDITGIELFRTIGRDLLVWQPYERLWSTGLTHSSWGQECGRRGTPVAYGYGSIIGLNGSSSESGRRFWVYYMKKPDGKCFDTRYLFRRLVKLA
jgi:hypothetical protein